MTATPEVETHPRGTAEIHDGVEMWRRSAVGAANAYAALRTGIADSATQALVAEGVTVTVAEDLASQLHAGLLGMQQAFVNLQQYCEAVKNVRQEMLDAAKRARSRAGERTPFVVN